jgi:uncharacterized LabA/DUF88 family protein
MTEFSAPLPILARYAIMVDVGYIYAAAGELLLGASSRREYRVDAASLIQALAKNSGEQLRGQLLRIYWYDAARDRVPTIDQRVIAQMPWVKLRLGNLNARGQQKGVDAQIRADMEALARHRAITDAVLVAGDEDMVPAVEAAQAFGVRVHLWGIEPPYGTNQAERLVWESDTVEVLDAAFVKPYFSAQPGAEGPEPEAGRLEAPASPAAVAGAAGAAGATAAGVPSPAELFGERHGPKVRTGVAAGVGGPAGPGGPDGPGVGGGQGVGTGAVGGVVAGPGGAPGSGAGAGVGAGGLVAASAGGLSGVPGLPGVPVGKLGPDSGRVKQAGEHVAQRWILTRGEDNIRDLLPGPILPPVIDKELLVEAEKELGQSLRPYQEAREWLRDAFWERVHRQFGIGTGRSGT